MLVNLFLHIIRMFSTLKQKWKEDVCQVHPQHRFGPQHQTGSVTACPLILALIFFFRFDIEHSE